MSGKRLGNQFHIKSWTYDKTGNILTRTDNGVVTTYGYHDPAHPHAVTHLNGVEKYRYDANGNMTYRDGAMLIYDAENRLTSVSRGSTRRSTRMMETAAASSKR